MKDESGVLIIPVHEKKVEWKVDLTKDYDLSEAQEFQRWLLAQPKEEVERLNEELNRRIDHEVTKRILCGDGNDKVISKMYGNSILG